MTSSPSQLQPSQDVMFILIGGLIGLILGGVSIGLLPLDGYGRRIALASWSFCWFMGIAYLITAGRPSRHEALGFQPCGLRYVGVGLVLGVVGMPLAGWFAAFLRTWLQGGGANPQLDYVILTHAPWIAKFTMGFLIIVALPFAEEVLYRGVLYDALERIRGPQFAIWMSSAIFGLMHFDLSISGATAFLGLIYGALRKFSGSIYPSFLAHLANNGLAYWVANAAH